MKRILNHLLDHKMLLKEEAYDVLLNIGKGNYTNSQIAAFLTVYLMRPVSVDELAGFRDALLDLCFRIDLKEFDTIDVCGTGGDGKNTFNISTLTAFVVAGAGYKVAKHGNYAVSSACGSSNVLEHLGYKFTNDNDQLRKQLDKASFCMIHAPLFHPAMKNVAPVRKELGVKTFFNMLGPLVNPSFPQNQIIGVFNMELARIYNYLFQKSDKNYRILYSLDGYDEISLTSPFKVISNNSEKLLFPEDIGVEMVGQEEIFGGNTIEEAAKIFLEIIKGDGTLAQNNVVAANAALAIQCFEKEKSIFDCLEIAKESLASGKAFSSFKMLISQN